jgi:hypothetical protein
MLHRSIILITLLFFSAFNAISVNYSFKEEIKWQEVDKVNLRNGASYQRLSFEGANYPALGALPYFAKNYSIHTGNAKLNVRLENAVYIALDSLETSLVLIELKNQTEIQIESSVTMSRKQPFASVYFAPLRWNEEKQIVEKLLSFDINIEVEDDGFYKKQNKEYAQNSVLKNGDWFKLRLTKGGVYKITYSQLQEMGFDVSVPVSKIALYGNGGGILPEINTDFRHDDLVENPIKIVDGGDGKLDAGDFILFYGDDAVEWKYNYSKQTFYHQTNYYDDYSYYFLTTKTNGDGKRIVVSSPPQGNPVIDVNDFDDYACHEIDKLNLAGSGRMWFGEVFDFDLSQTFTFEFPNIINNNAGKIYAFLASKAISSNQFLFSINDQLVKTQQMGITPNSGYSYGKERRSEFGFTPKSDKLDIELKYQRISNSSTGYLNYIEVNVDRNLVFVGNQMRFRKALLEADKIAKYKIGGNTDNVEVWDITDPTNATKQQTFVEGGKTIFTSSTDTLKQFIALNGNEFYTAEFVETVANQNLHSLKNIDYLIISHPDFLAEANRLATFHRENQDLTIYITTPQKIYNEFSSGSQDISAIRDFSKMLYDLSDAGKELKYLLLFGDASYDYKDILPDNTNYVPCWEHDTSLDIISSIASDDYFGFLDDGEGAMDENNKVDIGIGRFVVATEEEAIMAVNKSIDYCTNTQANMGPWRNQITFVADDGDSNTHLKDAEILSDFLDENYPVYNVDKIYMDAYPQISTPSGQKAPQVNTAINSKIEKGTLIFNYSGHGGELGLAHETIMQISDITSWNNKNKLPIFITATCEFARYDDPSRKSAGEEVFMNSHGGAIALFTTTRATYASSNRRLNMAIYSENLFEKVDGEYPRFGDVIRKSKKIGDSNDKKFILIGDPALRLAYPEYTAITTKINSKIVVDDKYDTINALSRVVVEGEVVDNNDQILSNYDGLLFPTVYDKKVKVQTLGADNGSYVAEFDFWKSILFNGKADIVNGNFKFEFIMPKDIAYNFGEGRISYYFNNDEIDGHGYYSNLIIGGFDDDASEDTQGPEISLFMNDINFQNGDMTDENPVLIAHIEDENGINTTGNGIGHDILAVIDESPIQTYILNDYYEAEVNRFNEGKISYPFFNLENGEHTLSFRVWDIYNNSSTVYLDFIVTSSEDLVISNLLNYPNPVTDNTSFVFEHNQSNKVIKVEIEVFDINGRLLKTLEADVNSENYKSEPIEWDARTDAGGKIGRGVYVYRLSATSESGQLKTETSKLVFIR